MNEAHQRFHDWLTGGAEGDPARDVAVHASVCPGCRQSMDALDLLGSVNTGLARMPVQPTGREHSRLVMAGRLVGATAVLFSAAILGVGVSQLIGVSRDGGPVAQASPTPQQSVLAETGTPQSSQPEPMATPTPPTETLTPLGPPAPTHAQPPVTPIPRRTPAPTPYVTPIATPVPSGTPLETATPTPTSTAVPTDTPVPTATPPVDTDGDGVTDADETTYGSDPNNILSTPENSLYDASRCADGSDNDLDTLTDVLDPGCS